MAVTTDQAGTKQILCMKWGGAYGPEYVNILYSMVARNITPPFQVYCFTDNPRGIRPEVTCLPIPQLGCEIPAGIPGKWKKSALWGRELFGLQGVALFIDLDSIIVGNIDDYFTYGDPEDVVTVRNWVKPHLRRGQTTIFRFKIGSHAYMLDNLRADSVNIARKYQYEQYYVTAGVRGGIKFWPRSWACHFRLHCIPKWPLRYFLPPHLPPKGVKIVACPGGPNPADVIKGIWRDTAVHRTPLAHFRYVFENRNTFHDGWWRELKRYVLPAPWVAEYWRED